MNEKELQDLLSEQFKSFKEQLPIGISKSDLDKALFEKSKEIENKFSTMISKEALDAEILKFSQNVTKDVDKKLKEYVHSNLEQKTVKDLLVASKALEKLRNKVYSEFEIKTVGDVTTSNVVVSTPQPKLSVLGVEGDLYAINRSTIMSILDFVDLGTTDKASITWVDEVEGEGSVSTTAEGNTKNQIDVDYQEKIANETKYTGFAKVTEESLENISYMEGEINRVLNEKLNLAKSAAVLAGIVSAATTFSLTDFDDSTNDADIIDAIIAATTQSEMSGFIPTSIVMNPIDVAKFQLTKSSNMPRIQTVAGRTMVNGLNVIRTTQITKGTFVLGDFSKYRVRIHKEKLVMGWDSDDFTKNKRTIIGESRLIQYVSSNEKTSFIKGTFATIIAALEANS